MADTANSLQRIFLTNHAAQRITGIGRINNDTALTEVPAVVLYEYPFNESIRTMLRLERLFTRLALLVPPAEQLNVTVAELLQGCRVEEEQRFTREETEELIRKALIFSAEPPERRQARTQKFLPLYGVSVVLGLVETAAVWAVGLAGTEGAMMLLIINVIFGIVYGAYTLFWMPETLPRYYDENHVCNFAQGAFHMHIPGVYYNNRNWLHVLKAMRVWCVVSMLLTPLCTAAAVVFEQATGWQVWRAVLIGYIASLFGAIVIPAKKYQ
jgi:hypothetical protein